MSRGHPKITEPHPQFLVPETPMKEAPSGILPKMHSFIYMNINQSAFAKTNSSFQDDFERGY